MLIAPFYSVCIDLCAHFEVDEVKVDEVSFYHYLFTPRLSYSKNQGRRGRPSTRSGSAWLPTRGQSVPRAARPHAPHDLSTSRCRSKMPSLHGGRRRLSDMEREPPSRRGIGEGRRPGDLFASFGALFVAKT